MELKINSDFRDLLPNLSKERFEGLEKMILEEGYDGTPILIWNGFIVDGHHRYKIFKKHNINFNIEEISLPKNSNESDVMEWIITYQDVRRNMCDAEKIYANDKVYTQRIKEENRKRKSEAIAKSNRNRKLNGVHLNTVENKQKRDKSMNTREQRAKLSGVSIGTVARYDKVMKSDDENLKESMLSGNVKIGTAYKEVMNKEKDKSLPKTSCNEEIKKICEFMKTERQGDFNYDIRIDIKSVKYISNDAIESIDSSIFGNVELLKYITDENCDEIIVFLNETQQKLEELIKKVEGLRDEKKKNNE